MKNLKSQAFKIAHEIKSQFATWSAALKAAWQIAKLKFGIETKIEFAKADGELRTAIALNVGSLTSLKEGFVRFLELRTDGITQWRSFRLERLILN